MNKIENPMKVKPIFPLLISMSVPIISSLLELIVKILP